jgi:16S rRNA (uracil1498-N3)-methyltransferase
LNLILFEPHEIDRPLPRGDSRARHILDVLGRKPGDSFDAGVVNGSRGKATLTALDDAALTLAFAWQAAPAPREPITLIAGLPRPQTARDILRDATTLGVGALHFVRTEKGESSYAQSTLWSTGEWRRHLITGAEQAFDTRIPEVTHGRTLAEVLSTLAVGGTRIGLDNYESTAALVSLALDLPLTLVLGAERGWSARERVLLRNFNFDFAHLGSRVLRTETAVVAALTLVRARLGLLG